MICSAYVVQFGERPEIDLNRISDDAFYHSHFYIKFDHALTEHLDNNSVTKDDDGILSFNLAEIDELNKRYEIREVKLLFNSPALDNRFKDRHRAWGFHLWFELQIDNKQDIREIISAYEKLDIITVAEPEYKKRLDTETKREGNLFRWTPNDPQLSNQWHYNNTGQQNGTPGADISLFDAWNIEKGNSDVIVAIIDSGVQYDHPDLSANMWSSIGYNFVNNNSTIIPGDHGTHVAGTVAAVNHNGIGVAGVAGGSGSGDGVRLMSCQVFTPDSNGGFHLAPVYAADNGAAISQNSWGYTQEGAYNQNVLDAIDYFNANGGGSALTDGITIFAAGNDETTGQWYPGCYSGAFSVAATNNQDKKSWYSTYDDWVDISAPGGETHQVTARGVLSTITGGNYAYYQGTSMACPHASGVAALIVSLAYGELTAGQVADILRDTTDDHYGVNPGYIGQLGTGRLNANAALLETQTYLGGVSNPQSFSANSTGMDSIELNWTKNADNDDVMIIWDTEGQFGSPQSGVFYNTGDFIPGGGTVLYTGSDTFFEHTGLQSGTTYYYKAFSYDTNGEYSFGRTTQATTDYEPFTLPFSEDFDAAATLPEFWEIVDHQGNGQVWQFGTISGALSGTSGNYAYLNSDDYGSNNSQNTDLITPTIDMSNYDDITLSFTHYFRQYLDVSSVTLSYSIDDGESWTTIQTWTETITNPTYFDQTIPQIAGQSQVRFKWNYTGTWGWYWCVDDIHISGSESLELLPPTDLSALAGDGVVELSWNAPESGTVQSYNIYRDDEDENFELIGSSSQSEYIDEYLINSLTYTYYVTAIYPEGDSEPSETIQATPLASPSELSAIYGDLFVELNWIAVANNRGEMDLSRLGISKKNVRISGQRTLEGYNLYRDSEQINTTIINNTNYIDTNVEYDTNYQYYVTAVYDEFGESVESNIVDIYLPNKVATPTFTPDSGLYTQETDITIQSATEGSTIMYRTSVVGSARDSWSDWQEYTTPITVPLDTEMDFEAYAQKEDWIESDTAEATYTVTGTVATPSFTPEPGLYTDATDVSIDTDTGGATVMYRTATDGGAWSDWQVFTTPITVPMDTKMDFEAYAEKADWADSDTAAATYTITGTVATPTFTPEPGLYTEATDVSINTATDGATVMYRTATDGGAWTDWQEYTTPITVPLDTEMDFEAYAQKEDWLTSETSEANYIVTGIVATPEFDPEGGIFHEAQIVAINTETAGATIEYSFDGESWLEGDTVGIEYSTMLYARAYLENWADSEITEDMYYILNPPQDLVSDAGDGYVDLTWQAPIGNRGTTRSDSHRLSEVESHREENGVIGYNIYRDEELIDSVGLIHTYHDDEVENLVEYTYYVTALYPEGESLPSNTTTALPLPDIAYGDVDDNGIVEAYDAALVLQYAVGMDPIPNIDPRPWEDWRFIRADVNGDDMIRAYDASLILQYAIDIINVFPVQQPGRHEQPEMVDITWLIDDEHLYLRTDNTEALYAAEFIIPNPDNISFGEIEFNAQLSEYMTNTHTNEQGMHIAFAAAIPIEHSDYLLRVPYQSEEYEILTIDVVSNVYESSLEIEFSPTETDEPIELITTLHRAYPNPFNPETTIGFSLADAGHVTIEIYNIRGQKIRTLVNSEYVAGQHSVVWDGKDERGREASGGVYLYRFRSQEHIETKRMLLFK